MSKRETYMKIRLTKKEHDLIIDAAEKDNVSKTKKGRNNVSAYARNAIFSSLSGKSKSIEVELRELKFQVRKIGVNINQVVKRINSGFEFSSDEHQLLLKLASVEKQLENLALSIEEIDINK